MLSIITVCFNDLDGLKKTYESIKLQNKDLDFEWVVWDGGSQDGTIEFLQNCREVDVYFSEKDAGIYDAMNKATAISNGDYLIYLNAGDVFARADAISTIFDNLNSDVIFFGANFKSGNSIVRYRAPREFKSVWHSVPANHQATIFNRKALGLKPYNEKLKICGDYDLISRIYMQGFKAKVINEPLIEFELGGISTLAMGKLAKEAAFIQKNVLNLPTYIIIFSYLRRLFVMYLNYFQYRYFN